MSAGEPILRISGLKKTFGGQAVLRGVDLDVYAGETLVIIGQSGSGKSLTIRHIVGLEIPDEGSVVVFGQDLSTLTRRARDRLRLRMGYLFQSGALLNWMTVEENVELPLLEHRKELRKSQRRDLVREKLEQVSLQDAAHKYPAEISGGMKKRAALARAMALGPEILLYDEPTAGLDPVIASTINDLIVSTAEKLGGTQIVVTHDMQSACTVGDRIAMLHEGRILAQGSPEYILHVENPVVRRFLAGQSLSLTGDAAGNKGKS